MNGPWDKITKANFKNTKMEREGQNKKRSGSLSNFSIHSQDPLLRMDPIRHPPEIHQSDFPIYTGSLWCSIWKYLNSSPDTYCPSEVFELSQKIPDPPHRCVTYFGDFEWSRCLYSSFVCFTPPSWKTRMTRAMLTSLGCGKCINRPHSCKAGKHLVSHSREFLRWLDSAIVVQ